MSDIIHMTAANTVKMLKMTQPQAHPSEAAVAAGKREPYHLTYIKKHKEGENDKGGDITNGQANPV